MSIDRKEIRKTIKKIQFQENPVLASHDELCEMNDNLDKSNDKLDSVVKCLEKLEKKEIKEVDLKPVIDTLKEENGKVCESVNELKPCLDNVGTTLLGVGKVLEELAKIRGSKFLGIFKDETDLPEDAIPGDYAIIESRGELWYV